MSLHLLTGILFSLLTIDVPIEKSVGAGGVNRVNDVKAVQERLKELGFHWLKVNGKTCPETIHAIKLFQGIKNGTHRVLVSKNDGRVDPDGETHKWLRARNAPRWMMMKGNGPGFVNVEIADKSDDHDFGTSWLNTTIEQVGAEYEKNYRKKNQATLISVNDASRDAGQDTPDHKGHETGLSVDLRLPEKGNSSAAKGGLTYNSEHYDQSATFAMLRAFRAHPLCKQSSIYFNDPDLIQAGLCTESPGHDNHIHVEISVPPRKN